MKANMALKRTAEIMSSPINVDQMVKKLENYQSVVQDFKVSENETILIETNDKEGLYSKLYGPSPFEVSGWKLYNYPEMTRYEPTEPSQSSESTE